MRAQILVLLILASSTVCYFVCLSWAPRSSMDSCSMGEESAEACRPPMWPSRDFTLRGTSCAGVQRTIPLVMGTRVTIPHLFSSTCLEEESCDHRGLRPEGRTMTCELCILDIRPQPTEHCSHYWPEEKELCTWSQLQSPLQMASRAICQAHMCCPRPWSFTVVVQYLCSWTNKGFRHEALFNMCQF